MLGCTLRGDRRHRQNTAVLNKHSTSRKLYASTFTSCKETGDGQYIELLWWFDKAIMSKQRRLMRVRIGMRNLYINKCPWIQFSLVRREACTYVFLYGNMTKKVTVQTVNASWKSYFECRVCFIDLPGGSRIVFYHNDKFPLSSHCKKNPIIFIIHLLVSLLIPLD